MYFVLSLLPLMLAKPEKRVEKDCTRNSFNITQMIGGMLKTYDTRSLPSIDGVDVQVEMHVQGISALSESEADFELDFMYSEIWHDKRLSFEDNKNICITNLTMKSDFRRRIWTPNICLVNSKQAEVHKSPSENTFIILNADGGVWANYRMKVRAPCHLNLRYFPFDHQQCTIVFESYSFNVDEVRLSWLPNEAVTFMDEIDLPDFELIGWRTKTQINKYPNGNWQRAEVTFVFTRRYGFYIFQTYFPTALTVISNCMTFHLDARAVSARITLSVSSLLALTFQFGHVLHHLPRVSHIKCIDVWLGVCTVFVFATMLEMAVVNRLNSRERERQMADSVIRALTSKTKNKTSNNLAQRESIKEQLRRRSTIMCQHTGSDESDTSPAHVLKLQKTQNVVPLSSFSASKSSDWMGLFWTIVNYKLSARKVDQFCVWAFPGSFLTFVILYFVIIVLITDNIPSVDHVPQPI